MNTFQSSGKRIPHVAGADIASGELVIIRTGTTGVCGIAVADIANGATGEVQTCGVHKVTAETGAWANGALLYRHASNKTLTTTATNNTLAGFAVGAKTTAATVGFVMLNGNPE
jgi:predicted RecA/RadA family phage recombinase